ncbi:gamma-glutamyltransferase [Saprospiraceae bacterium]|nr:gamma-glutamyltransferase [Saprospiraceae bacterium]
MKAAYLILLLLVSYGLSAQVSIYESDAIHHPVVGQNGMVATQHPIATEVGIQILEKGGNAVDAAVAVGFALAVVLPRAGNLGGGGFMIVYDEKSDDLKAINYREMAPAAATKDMYLDDSGDVDSDLFNRSYLSIGVPGTVAGLCYALEQYGTMSLKQVMKPAIRLAKKGFEITYDLELVLMQYEDRLKSCKATQNVFYKKSGYYSHGEVLKQDDLAWSLKQISKKGKDAFYNGEVGQRIVEGVSSQGGILSLSDFQNYTVSVSDPVMGQYKGYEIASMPPPSSGGVHLIQMLNLLEPYDIKALGFNSAECIHLMAETMRLAYADRSQHMGDPEFWDVPVAGLISKAYANELRKLIKRDTVNSSADIKPGQPQDYESEETTHFSIVDKWGNAVSNTYTLNFSFGTGLMAEGTGILLNNEMGDFAAKPGAIDAYGLVGGVANAVEPNKRPLSSMTPTIVLKDDKPFLVTGSPGGSRIITTVLQIILNVIDHDMNISEATHAPRIHHQWYHDVLYYDGFLSIDTKRLLVSKGHTVQRRAAMGSTQSIVIRDGLLFGASDPRRPDGATMGY